MITCKILHSVQNDKLFIDNFTLTLRGGRKLYFSTHSLAVLHSALCIRKCAEHIYINIPTTDEMTFSAKRARRA